MKKVVSGDPGFTGYLECPIGSPQPSGTSMATVHLEHRKIETLAWEKDGSQSSGVEVWNRLRSGTARSRQEHPASPDGKTDASLTD